MRWVPAPAGGRWLAAPILATSLLAFAGVLTGGALYFRDLTLLHRPVRSVIRAQWGAGHLPLWDPLADGGRHLLANPNHLVLHPVALLDLALPLDAALAAGAILQVFLAGWGLALLLSSCGASAGAARLGGLAWSLSGPLLSLGNLPNMMGAVAWVPLAAWAGGRALAAPARWLPAAALVCAVPLLAGGAEVLPFVLALLAARAAAGPGPGRRLALAAATVGGGVLLASVQILPAWTALAESERGVGFRPEQLLHWSMPPQRLLEAVIPGLWGNPVDPARWWGGRLFDMEVPLILSAYLGSGVLVLALVGTAAALRPGAGRTAREPAPDALAPPLLRLVQVSVGLGLVLLLLALGRHNPLLALEGGEPLPGAVLRYPERLLPLVALAVAVAAAAGWDALAVRRRAGRPLPASAWVGAALVGGGVSAAMVPAAGGRFLPGLGTGITAAREAAAAAALARGGATALAVLAALGVCLWMLHRRPAAATSLATLVVALDLLAAGAGLNPTVEADLLTEVPEAAQLIAAESRDAGVAPRLLRHEEPPVPGEGIPPGLEVAWSRRSLSVRVPEEYGLAPMLAGDVDRSAPLGNAYLRAAHERSAGAARERLADRAAVTWEVGFAAADEAVPAGARAVLQVFPRAPAVVLRRRPDAAPRWSLVPGAEHVGSLSAPGAVERLLGRLADPAADPGEVVFLSGGPPPAAAPPGGGRGEAREGGQVHLLRETPTEMLFQVSAPAGGVLVLRDSHVRGWRAEVGGEDRPVRRADLAWRAVELAPGTHQVAFSYRQPHLAAGAGLSGVGLLLCVALPAVAWLRERRWAGAGRRAGKDFG